MITRVAKAWDCIMPVGRMMDGPMAVLTVERNLHANRCWTCSNEEGWLCLRLLDPRGGLQPRAIFDALNIVYGEEEKRSFFKLNAVTLFVTLGIVVFILLTLAAVVALPVALTYIPLPGVTALVVRIGRWPILFALVTLALAVLYKYGPSRAEPRWRWITWGSVSAAVVWLAASALFSWYVASFGSYNKTYGSLGAIIGFMTWIWISIIVVLVGAKLNAEMEHQTVRESTTGQPKPLGRRGARMADTVGAAQG
jgi:membrane protein